MLIVDISFNRTRHISSIGAEKIRAEKNNENDTICTYRVGRVYDGKIKREIGMLKHRFEDGDEVLAGKIIDMATSFSMSALEEDNLERLLNIAKINNS